VAAVETQVPILVVVAAAVVELQMSEESAAVVQAVLES
jgi:hypothetical protein